MVFLVWRNHEGIFYARSHQFPEIVAEAKSLDEVVDCLKEKIPAI